MNNRVLESMSAYVRETAMLSSIEGLLGWDERTMLPPQAGQYRADQMAYVAGLVHARRTDRRLGEWLEQLLASSLATDPHSEAGATIRELKRDHDKRTRVPQTLVEQLSRAAVLGQQAWVQARKDNDYRAFQGSLDAIIQLKREEAQAIGYADHIYDAMLDEYEPGERTANVTEVLQRLREALVPLVAEIGASRRRPRTEILRRSFNVDAQRQLGREAAAAIGFSFDRGRLDVTDHPFCSSVGPHDCRITTRYEENLFSSAFFGTLHEAGHGLYDQGLRVDQFGLPPGTYVSLGIHESQSRMWENLVGRSRCFWEWLYPRAQQLFSSTLADVPLDDFYFAINHVEPSLIRVEADEATYNLHIVVRFELEQALMTGDLTTDDLPGAWNENYRRYLGVEPPNDSDGVLQDIHWSAALIGYFPTYALGNLYAAQLYQQADRDLGGIESFVRDGQFAPLLKWLREHIHHHGQCYSAPELVQRATGEPLSHRPFLDTLRAKLEPLYEL